MLQQCTNCTFANPELSVECQMCGEPLPYGRARRKQRSVRRTAGSVDRNPGAKFVILLGSSFHTEVKRTPNGTGKRVSQVDEVLLSVSRLPAGPFPVSSSSFPWRETFLWDRDDQTEATLRTEGFLTVLFASRIRNIDEIGNHVPSVPRILYFLSTCRICSQKRSLASYVSGIAGGSDATLEFNLRNLT